MGEQTSINVEPALTNGHISHLIGSTRLKEDLIILRESFNMGKTEPIELSRLKTAFPSHDWEEIINRFRRVLQSQTMAGKVFNCAQCVKRGGFCGTHSFYSQILTPEEVKRFNDSHTWKHKATGQHSKSKCVCGND